MPTLTRRRYPERPSCWHFFYDDVQVGCIAGRAGVPVDVDQWGWQCGFSPASDRGHGLNGTAETFDPARADFEAAWRAYLPKCTEADFEEYRRQRAWTAWKYAMRDAGRPLPTQQANGWATCFCGAAIDNAGLTEHVYAVHMKPAAEVFA
jgi:hypothetical protein